MKFDLITTDQELQQFCTETAGQDFLGFDTEFVSENLYRPQLCLVQAATRQRTVLIDSMVIRDLTPFWSLICNQIETVVAHAAREEFLFCYRESGQRPSNLFDLQIAAGFAGFDYPAAYSTLVEAHTGTRLAKGETRTDWRVRPLSQRQMQYAAQDVEHLLVLYERFQRGLERRGRTGWYREEVTAWMNQLEEFERSPAWIRLSGLNRLSRRSLAIVRELSSWRDQTASAVNRSPRRILPDDLLLEIAKRGEADAARVKAIRGLSNRVSGKHLPEIVDQVQAAMAIPEADLPEKIRGAPSVNLGILGQFLQTGLNLICVREKIAPGLVANVQDVRDLAGRMLGMLDPEEPLRLDSGWRREIVGTAFSELLSGKLALRVASVNREQPLEIVRWEPGENSQ